MATAFSSSGQDAISRELPLNPTNIVVNPTTREQLILVEELYEVEWTADVIAKGGFKQVALQFPDELLHISVPIYRSLKKRLSPEIGVYVLADTSYGSCCVDEVAAQHIDADVIVHYGYSCLSRPSRVPVFYVFSKAQLNVEDAADSLLQLAFREHQASGSGVPHFVLITDVAYAHVAGELHAELAAWPLLPPDSRVFFDPAPKSATPAPLPSFGPSDSRPGSSDCDEIESDSNPTAQPPSLPQSHRRYTLPATVPVTSCTILYVGPESLGLTNLLMTHPTNTVISYDPNVSTPVAKVESSRTNRLLMRRYAVVQQARDADVFGILVGTLGVASYLPLLSHIRKFLAKNHKKAYTLSVGKLNPAKLANFAEIECFVMVACPENSVIDSKDFLRPIITPFELSLSLSAKPSWPGTYVLDFERITENQDQALQETAAEGDEKDSDQPLFSLVTGKYRHAKRYGQDDEPLPTTGDGLSVVLRNTDNSLATMSNSAGADFLQQRTFKGLEQRLGEDAPGILEQGRTGIARGYQDDHPPPDNIPR